MKVIHTHPHIVYTTRCTAFQHDFACNSSKRFGYVWYSDSDICCFIAMPTAGLLCRRIRYVSTRNSSLTSTGDTDGSRTTLSNGCQAVT